MMISVISFIPELILSIFVIGGFVIFLRFVSTTPDVASRALNVLHCLLAILYTAFALLLGTLPCPQCRESISLLMSSSS